TSDGRTATVTTALGNREGGEVPVEYRLIKRDGRWAIFDVVIDGASLVDNYKLLFSRVIGQSSYSDVVALMKPRPSEARAATAPAAPKPPAPGPAMAYWLQVGAFKNPEAAGGLAARLRTQNLPVSIESVTVPPGQRGTQLSRVRVGPFADQTEATAKLREL